MGLTIPTRGFAATFSAVGIVATHSSCIEKKPLYYEHYEKLIGLVGTHVLYRRGNTRLRGVILSTKNIGGEDFIVIQTDSDEGKHLVPKRKVLNIALAESDTKNLPKRQKGKPIIGSRGFLDEFIGEGNFHDFTMRTRLECLILGSARSLRQEIVEVNFSLDRHNTTDKQGTLQDILRVRNFMGEGQPYRTGIIPVRRRIPPQGINNRIPHTVIFDGPLGFLKYRNAWRESNWIVILDRTDRNTEEAAKELNAEFLQNRSGEPVVDEIIEYPPGVEVMVYEELRQ